MKRTHYNGVLRLADVNKEVSLVGWVHRRRDHGGLIFIDLRDRSGLVQIVFSSDDKALLAEAEKLRAEYVIHVKGQVVARATT